jgi:hypothetical protein
LFLKDISPNWKYSKSKNGNWKASESDLLNMSGDVAVLKAASLSMLLFMGQIPSILSNGLVCKK